MQFNGAEKYHLQDESLPKEVLNEIKNVIEDTNFSVLNNLPASNIKKHLINEFKKIGYVSNIPLFYGSNRKIDLLRNNEVGLHIQFGNHAQVWFDVLKMGYLHDKSRIKFGIIITFNKETANKINGGMTNFEDTILSYKEFSDFIRTTLIFVEIS